MLVFLLFLVSLFTVRGGSATYTAPEVAEKAGCSTWLLYQLIRENRCPFPFIRLGERRIVFPRSAVDRQLGLENTEAEADSR